MFDGVTDQFHQFITPMTSLPLHLPFPLHSSAVVAAPTNTTFPSFDPYNPSPHQLPLQHQPNLLRQLHHPSTHKEHEHEKGEEHSTLQMNFEIERDHNIDPWTNDEVLALLRIRSSMESWFPELTWEHVSRKLAELGYKRSSDKCKEKFEEESRYFNNISYTKNNNYRFLSEIEELYNHGDNHEVAEIEKPTNIEEGQDKIMDLEEGSRKQNEQGDNEEEMVGEKAKEDKRPKRKRPNRFEMFKGFCESIVHKMMEQQEEMHNKLIKDMMKRDEEKIAREEEWKKQEMDRMNQDLEIIAQEQAIAGDRQANIIEFLNKFSTTVPSPNSSKIKKDGVGRRWPKDEVLALINLRCSSLNNNNNEEKEGNKPPLWERISQGMLELGYERSAKRCKEKWENINKYFKKAKDVNKKRSLDSRTCPYFHQLNNLYNQGRLVLHSEKSKNELTPQANQNQSQIAEPYSEVECGGFSMQQQQVDHHGGEKTLVQVPSLDFDQF
ncbi:putative transcription factor MYB family [Lupinus albus]|uniref:Putative transcription factor MYB family n=1 Tax=Lupinus albus TaxID=3870 RepID=A0A6A4NJG2_LUPAL|nr:putative transcription factor MYB family [Lupinus albus]